MKFNCFRSAEYDSNVSYMQKQVNIPMLLNMIFTVRAAPGAAVLMAGVLCLIKLLSRRLRINVILNGIEKDLFEALRGIHIPGRLPGMAVKEMANQAGFQLDHSQNIFYSKITAWQRRFGYCRLYDEAAAPLGMIIDCEPIYFTYDGRQWLIEFWKGQYGMTTGAEMGVYYTQEDGARPETLFYHGAVDRDMLKMCCVVRRSSRSPIQERLLLTGLRRRETVNFAKRFGLPRERREPLRNNCGRYANRIRRCMNRLCGSVR